jgi:hypothetical protein
MENVAPSRALSRRSTQLLQLGFVVLAIGFFLAILGLVLGTIQLVSRTTDLYPLYILFCNILFGLGVILGLVGVAMAIRAVTRRRENDLALITGQFLEQFLDGRYSYIRNINRSGLGYIDAVLLGPPGALVFRILDNQGAFANEASNWLTQNRQGEWVPFSTSPTREAVDDIQHLRQYLAKHNMSDVPVFGVIVFTHDETRVKIAEKSPVVPISHLPRLYENLRRDYLSREDRIPQQAVTAIRGLLLET